MIELQNKVVLITGATSGIGYATATRFASLGAKVVGTARHETDFAAELMEAGASAALLLTADMTIEDQVVKAIDDTLQKFGQLHFAFNNAGIFLHEGIVNLETIEQMSGRSSILVSLSIGGRAACHAFFRSAPVEEEAPILLLDGAIEVGSNLSNIVDTAACIELFVDGGS